MDHKIKVSSNTATTSRSILIPQKKNIKFDFYEDNHHTACATTDSSRKKEKVAVSKKVVAKSTNAVISSSRRKVDHNPIVMIPSITTTMIIDESKRKDIAVDKAVVSDYMVEAFQEYFKSNIQPDSTIFYERIMEEIVRIRRRANVLLSDEQRHEMIRLALAMDVTKLARKIVNDNKELMHESMDNESFLTAGMSSDMMMVSIDNSDNDDDHDNDAQFCKAFDEVERIRKRIIQQASVPFSANNTDSITVATTSNDDREPSITLDSQSIFRDYGDDHDEDHLTVSSNMSNHISPNILLKPSVTELEHPSQPSWTYLEPSTEKQFDTEDLSFFGTFKFEFLNNTNSGSSLIDGTSSSSSSSSLIEYLPITQSNRPITDQSINRSAKDAKMKSKRNENLHNNKKLNQNHTYDYSDGITTSSFSPRGNREVALSLDSIIGSRSSTSEASRTTDKQSSELSYLILRQQLEAAVTPQKDKGSYHYRGGGGYASSAPLLNDSHSTTDHQFSTVNDLFSSKQLLTTSSTSSSSSSSSVVVQSDVAVDKNDFDTTHQLVENTCTIKSSSSPSPSASKKKSRIAIALATMDTPHHGGQSSLPINNNIDHPSSQPHNSRVGGKADMIHYHNSMDNSDNTNTSGKRLHEQQSSKLDRHRKQLTHNSSSPVKKNFYFDSVDSVTHESANRLTMEARDDHIKYKSHYYHNANINSIDDGVDAIISSSSSSSSVSKQLQFGAKLLLSSPMTSWIPAHMHRSRDNDSKVLSRNSSAISLEPKKLSLEELPMLLESDDVGGRRQNHDHDGLYSMLHHGATTAIVDNAKGNEGDMDNVYKSLQLLNDHLSQFQSSVVVGKSCCDDDDDDDDDEIGDVKWKGDNISSYDDNGHVIVPSSDLDDDNDIDDDSNVKQVHEQYHECKGLTMQYKKNKKNKKKTQLDNNDLHVSNRDDVVVTSSNSSSSETTTSGNSSRMEKEQKSRVRRQIEESIRFNTQQTQLQQVPPPPHHPSSHNYSHHHIHQQQGHDSKSGQLQLRRMGALAAALDAGDAVGKLMAEMLISSR